MDTDKIQFTDKTVKLEKITLSKKKNKQRKNVGYNVRYQENI